MKALSQTAAVIAGKAACDSDACRRTFAFTELAALIHACRACPAMDGRRRVFSALNGDPAARILFVAEAPGRLGGEMTGVPLSRDQSGKRFTRLLQAAGLARDSIFITNAALCNPQDDRGCNRPPSAQELRNCAAWLAATLATIAPSVVVSLGATALAALARVAPHALVLREAVGRPVRWRGCWLYPLYHPSPRAGISRTYAEQDADFQCLGSWIRQMGFIR